VAELVEQCHEALHSPRQPKDAALLRVEATTQAGVAANLAS
jgi:hypothetical protein